MPFRISVDADATLEQLDTLQGKILGLEQKLTETFVAWQTDDMNRKFPSTEGGGYEVSTVIYPRSRLVRRKKGGGGKARRRARIAAGRPGSSRPILRPELFEQLKQRMEEMLEEASTWQ